MNLRPARTGTMAGKRAPDLDAIINMMKGTSTLEGVQYFRQQFPKVMNQLGMSDQNDALAPKFQEYEDSVAHMTNLRNPKLITVSSDVALAFKQRPTKSVEPAETTSQPEAGPAPAA